MTTKERKRMMVKTIRKLEDEILSLKATEYDGCLSMLEREDEIANRQKHIRTAHSVLLLINEAELEDVG